MGLRFLVVEGNTRDARLAHKAAYGLMPSESYASVLQDVEPEAVCDLAFPTDEGSNLPDPAGLQSYDGIVLTGSMLNLYDGGPAVARQIDLMRAIYASATPAFGSCWGVQIGAAAAGGDVRRNPKGARDRVCPAPRPDGSRPQPPSDGRTPGRLRRACDPPRLRADTAARMHGARRQLRVRHPGRRNPP
jgi:GMP synthase (glutamine-hydrolysing)